MGVCPQCQPYAGGQEDQKAQPSDGHVQRKPRDSMATGPLPEEDASIKRQVNRLHKSRPSDLSYMERRHHLEWHRFRKHGSPNGRRRQDRFCGLKLILRADRPAGTSFVDLLDGDFVGDPSFVQLTRGGCATTEIVVVFVAHSCHDLLKSGQFIFKVFNRVVEYVQSGGFLSNHLPKIMGLITGLEYIAN